MKNTIINLPSQFAIADHGVFLLKSAIGNSARAFYSYLFEEVKTKDLGEKDPGPISFKEIKELYEKYCFLRHYPEKNLLNEVEEKYLNKMGFVFSKNVDLSSEAFQRIRFKRAKMEGKLKDSPFNSLELFIREECELTQFEEDTIVYSDFKQKYNSYLFNLS